MAREAIQATRGCAIQIRGLSKGFTDEVYRQFNRMGRLLIPPGHDGIDRPSDADVYFGR